MKTKIFTSKQIQKAAAIIKKGGLIAFPTETVYGLGANALNPMAVKKIFSAKGRPLDNPLIVHISKKEQLNEIAFTKPEAKKIIANFWPGPLTIILKKKKTVPSETTANLNTVAVRMPKNKIALKLIDYAGVPIAAPSANLSGKPSGTCFEDVWDDFNGKIAGIIKSKKCEIGIESTVINLTSKPPVLLRPGGTSFEKLKKVLPDLILTSHKKTRKPKSPGSHKKTRKPKSPGMKYRHYSPQAKIILFEKTAKDKIKYYRKIYQEKNKKIKIINPQKIKNFPQKLFKIFRQYDKEKIDYLLISSVKEKDIGLAIMNRLRKAASKIIK